MRAAPTPHLARLKPHSAEGQLELARSINPIRTCFGIYCYTRMQALSDPTTYGGLSESDQASFRQSLAQAVNATLALVSTLDSATTTVLVQALSGFISSATNIDSGTYSLLLSAVQTLSSYAGSAADSMMGVLSTLIRSQPGGSAGNTNVLRESINNLALSVLSDAVCGEAPSTYTSDGIRLHASYQSSFANTNVSLSSGATVTYGSGFDSAPAVSGAGSCKKMLASSQDTAPYVSTNVNDTYVYACGHEMMNGLCACMRRANARLAALLQQRELTHSIDDRAWLYLRAGTRLPTTQRT